MPEERVMRESGDRLVNLVVRLEILRNRIPYSVIDGSMEETLRSIALEIDAGRTASEGLGWARVVRNMLYSDLRHEAFLLSKLAKALRRRMSAYGRPEISGVDYLTRRIDSFLERIRGELGFHPRIPISMQHWRDLNL
ncbi:hypothetical protein [Stetteria hydrogenophila]